MNAKNIFSILGINLLVIFSACKKEKNDEEPPSINCYSPGYNSAFNMSGNIRVTGKAIDNVNLEFVYFYLSDHNGNSVQGAANFTEYEVGKEFNFDFEYPLFDESLETGNYFFCISAGDGNSITTTRIPVFINSPLNKKGYCFNFKRNNFQYETSVADTNFQLSILSGSSFSQKPNGYLLSNRYKILGLVGKSPEAFKEFSIQNSQTLSTLPSLNASLPYFTCSGQDKDFFYIGYYNDSIEKRIPGGNSQLSYSCNDPNFYPSSISALDGVLAIQFISKTTSGNRFILFNKNNAQVLATYYNNSERIFSFEDGNGNSYLLENLLNGSRISLMNNSSGNVVQLLNLPGGKITDACQIDGTSLLIASTDGNLYQFSYNPLNLISIFSSHTFEKISYSSDENKVYGANGNRFEIFEKNPFSLTQKGNFLFSDSIMDFKVIYNR